MVGGGGGGGETMVVCTHCAQFIGKVDDPAMNEKRKMVLNLESGFTLSATLLISLGYTALTHIHIHTQSTKITHTICHSFPCIPLKRQGKA